MRRSFPATGRLGTSIPIDVRRRSCAAAPSPALRALLLLAALLGGFFISPAVARAEEVRVGPDRVRWDSRLESLGREAASALPRLRAEVHRRLGFPDDGRPLEVVLLSGHEPLRRESGANAPVWAVGLAQPQRGVVIVRADLLAEGYGGGLVATLRHELVHVAWGRRAGPRARGIPLWLEEGIAEELGGGLSLDLGAALDLAAVGGGLLPFDQLATSFPADPRQADLAYKQARSWVRHFLAKRGWDDLRAILEHVAEGRGVPDGATETPFAFAVRERSGRGVGEWHVDWEQAVKAQARPWFHLVFSDLGGALLTGAALVAAGCFFVLRRRRRRQIAALETGTEVPVAEDVEG